MPVLPTQIDPRSPEFEDNRQHLAALADELRTQLDKVAAGGGERRLTRTGLVDVALGAAGIQPLRDHRGEVDPYGNELVLTSISAYDDVDDARPEETDASPADVLTGVLGVEPSCTAVWRSDAAELLPDDPRLVDLGIRLAEGGAQFRGILTHHGGSYAGRSGEELAAFAEEERLAAVTAATALRAAGLPCPVVSVGSTPTASRLRPARAAGLTCG